MRVLNLLPLLLALGCAQSLRILGVFPVASYSHYAPGARLMGALAERGHDVTVIAPYTDKSSKFKTIHLTGFEEAMEEMKKEMNMFEITSRNWFDRSIFIHFMGYGLTNSTLNHENFKKLMNSKQQFDVVVVEHFVNEAMQGICNHFSAACVIYSALPSLYWTNSMVRNPENPSYMPQMALQATGKMGFCERVQNTLFFIFSYVAYNAYFLPQQGALMKEHFPKAPPLTELFYQNDIILLNSHPGMSEVVPHVPSMIEIGGFHVKPPQNLPKDLQTYLDEAKEGVVLFSMGSVLKSKEMPKEKLAAIFKSFAKLKVKVLWKFEQDDLPNKPSNVKIMKWVPQQDVLPHPNVKAFITHSGLFSTIEAMYFGVPIIAIPIFGDQEMNAMRSVGMGIGVQVNFKDLNEKSLDGALNEILGNKKYSENVKQRSKMLQDRPMKPIDTAMFWVEYAARHKGSTHMKTAGLAMPFYQYALVDVFAFLFAIMFGIIGAIVLVLRCVCGSRSKKTVDKDKKRK